MAEEKENRWIRIKNFLTEGSNKVKIFFVLLSVFLWFLSKLSKEGYTAIIDFPVKYVNLEEGRSFGQDPPKKIKVYINSPGFTILKYKLRSFSSLKIDLKGVERNIDSRNSYWLTNSDLSLIENQLDPDVEVRSISPDTVFFDFTHRVKKKVPVVLKIQENYSKDLGIYGEPKITPDSIIVSGAESVIKDIVTISTDELELNGEEELVATKLKLKIPKKKGIEVSNEEVDVELEFSKLTETSINVPIEVVGLPQKYSLKIFPETVKLTYQVAIRDYERVAVTDFRIYTDCSDIENNASKRYLNLQSSDFPDFVKNVHFEPKRIEFILSEQ